jgi:hypothetical protein
MQWSKFRFLMQIQEGAHVCVSTCTRGMQQMCVYLHILIKIDGLIRHICSCTRDKLGASRCVPEVVAMHM